MFESEDVMIYCTNRVPNLDLWEAGQRWLFDSKQSFNFSHSPRNYRKHIIRATLRDIQEPMEPIFFDIDKGQSPKTRLQLEEYYRTMMPRAIKKYGSDSEQVRVLSLPSHPVRAFHERRSLGNSPADQPSAQSDEAVYGDTDFKWLPSWFDVMNLGR